MKYYYILPKILNKLNVIHNITKLTIYYSYYKYHIIKYSICILLHDSNAIFVYIDFYLIKGNHFCNRGQGF